MVSRDPPHLLPEIDLTSRATRLLFAPAHEEEKVIFSQAKLNRLLKEAQEWEEQRARLREQRRRKEKRFEALEPPLAAHADPSIPPSVRDRAPGHPCVRFPIPEIERKKPGPKPGHERTIRDSLPTGEHVEPAAKACLRCHGHQLLHMGP